MSESVLDRLVEIGVRVALDERMVHAVLLEETKRALREEDGFDLDDPATWGPKPDTAVRPDAPTVQHPAAAPRRDGPFDVDYQDREGNRRLMTITPGEGEAFHVSYLDRDSNRRSMTITPR